MFRMPLLKRFSLIEKPIKNMSMAKYHFSETKQINRHKEFSKNLYATFANQRLLFQQYSFTRFQARGFHWTTELRKEKFDAFDAGKFYNKDHIKNVFTLETVLKDLPISSRWNFIQCISSQLNSIINTIYQLNTVLKLLPDDKRINMVKQFKNLVQHASDIRDISLLLTSSDEKKRLFYQFNSDDYLRMSSCFDFFEYLLEAFPEEEQVKLMDMFDSNKIFDLVYSLPHPVFSLSSFLKSNVSHQVKEHLFDILLIEKKEKIKQYYINYIVNEKINPIRPVRLSCALRGLPQSAHRVLLEWIGPENLYEMVYGKETGPFPSANLEFIFEHLSEADKLFVKNCLNKYERSNNKSNYYNDKNSHRETFFKQSSRVISDYEILGIKEGASKEEIKRAYIEKARNAHPDLKGGDGDLMKKINGARDRLLTSLRERFHFRN